MEGQHQLAAPSRQGQRLNVQSFPRPPAVERCNRHVQIKWCNHLICDTNDAYWVLEMHYPPTYYIPAQQVKLPVNTTPRTTYCEWKGTATYYGMMSPIDDKETVQNRIWAYNDPLRGYEVLRNHLAFYPGPWECYVDGERVQPQPGDFHGGWVTSDVEGVMRAQWGQWDQVM